MSIDIGFDLQAAFGSLKASLDDNTAQRQRDRATARALTPFATRLSVSGTSAASGDLALSLGGPDPGYYWMVHGWAVGGQTPSSTAAGTAELYITGASGGLPGSPSTYASLRLTSDWIDKMANLGNVVNYGDDQVVVKANETLVTVIHSPTAANLYVVHLRFHVYRDQAAAAEFTA